MAAIVPARRGLDHGTEEDLLIFFLHGVSCVRALGAAVRLRALQALLEAAYLTLQALHHRFLGAGLWTPGRLRRAGGLGWLLQAATDAATNIARCPQLRSESS